MEKQTFTVTELNNRIKNLLDRDPFLADVCVRGELSNYKIYPSGHHYFTLKDSESSLRCVMFKSSASKLRFRPESGMGVTAFGRVSVFPRDGAYQLYCNALMPEGTGDLQVAFEQLKAKLSAEGLFDPAHKKPLPPFPERIAIITSSAGAAVHDMIRILSHRWPMTKVLLLPVRVQGTEAPAEIAGAIRYANEFKVADLIITGRGGGSIEDLWAFNDERVARAVYACPVPVISAVGHETDYTICDFTADLRAPTPSAAAELAAPDCSGLLCEVQTAREALDWAMSQQLSRLRRRTEELSGRLAAQSPVRALERSEKRLSDLSARLDRAAETGLRERELRLRQTAAALEAMSPLKVLARGYSIARKEDGPVLSSVSGLQPGERIRTVLSDGELTSEIVEIRPGRRKD